MNTKTQANSISELTELKSLKKQINEGFSTTSQLVKSVKDRAAEALAEGTLTGHRLVRAKQLVPYGQWIKWLKTNCKSISERTAQRYMYLATHQTELLSTDIGLRKAYAILGIIKEDGDTTSNPVLQKPILNVKCGLAKKAAASVTTAVPMISNEDALSRPRYLVSELLNDLNHKLNSKSTIITLSQLEVEVLQPIQRFFTEKKSSCKQ